MAQLNHLQACPSLNSTCPERCSCEQEELHYLRLAKFSFTLFMFELIGGLFSGSMALISDALHVILDGTENIVSAVVSRLVLNGGNEQLLRDIGGKTSALLLLIAGAGIIYEGWERILSPHKVEGYMVVFAMVGLCVNLWQKTLHNKALHEHRNQTHLWQNRHLVSDIAASIAVIVGGVIMLIAEKWYWIDGILSIGIGLLVATFTLAKLFGFELHTHHHGEHEHDCEHHH